MYLYYIQYIFYNIKPKLLNIKILIITFLSYKNIRILVRLTILIGKDTLLIIKIQLDIINKYRIHKSPTYHNSSLMIIQNIRDME